jgi:hypothetical protein
VRGHFAEAALPISNHFSRNAVHIWNYANAGLVRGGRRDSLWNRKYLIPRIEQLFLICRQGTKALERRLL